MRTLVVNTLDRKSRINKNIYGHFSEHLGRCIYEGIFVGEQSDIPNVNGMRKDVVEALRQIKIPVLRWPGGCFADEYHWKDGVGPREGRKKMINTHWGGVTEDNSFGTHEFMELCRQLGCAPYVNGNLGSGTVQEMSEWVEYMTFDGVSPMAELRERNGHSAPWKVNYFGVGNENWGCGGNMRPEFYADQYRRFQTYVRDYGSNKMFRIACGPNGNDYHWTETLMKQTGAQMDGLTLHYYTIAGDNWQEKGPALHFTKGDYYKTLSRALVMEQLVTKHAAIMDRWDPDRKVGLIVDEWGTWFDVEPGTNPGFLYQQNTMRDAMVAAATLNIFNRHSDRVCMANIAQTVNVLQAVLFTEGNELVRTPTYHVFDLYKAHQDATLVDSFVQTEQVGEGEWAVPDLSVSASEDGSGALHITLANLDGDNDHAIDCLLVGKEAAAVSARVLTGSLDAYNDFDQPDTLSIRALDGVQLSGGKVTFTAPRCSVVELTVL